MRHGDAKGSFNNASFNNASLRQAVWGRVTRALWSGMMNVATFTDGRGKPAE